MFWHSSRDDAWQRPLERRPAAPELDGLLGFRGIIAIGVAIYSVPGAIYLIAQVI